MVKDTPKVSRIEIVGAWLGVWTPPRDAEIPPVPWRKLAIGTAVLLVAGGAAAAVIVPRVDEGKERTAAVEQRGLDERRAARRERIRREQVPRTGTLAASDSRGDVLAAIETAIGTDARERFNPRARPATCAPAPGVDEGAGRVAYDCVSAVRDIVGGRDEGVRGVLAIPFRAVVDYDRRRYAFCKVNPPPGEQVIPDPRELIQLPRACRR